MINWYLTLSYCHKTTILKTKFRLCLNFVQFLIPATVSTMVSNLPHEFRKFMRSSQLLSRILTETSRSLKEIDDAGFFQGGETKI